MVGNKKETLRNIKVKLEDITNKLKVTKDKFKALELLRDLQSLEQIYYHISDIDLDIDFEQYLHNDVINYIEKLTTRNDQKFVTNFGNDSGFNNLLTDNMLSFYNKSAFKKNKFYFNSLVSNNKTKEILEAFFKELNIDYFDVVKEIFNNKLVSFIDFNKEEISNFSGLSYMSLPLDCNYILCQKSPYIDKIMIIGHEIGHLLSYYLYKNTFLRTSKFCASQYVEVLSYTIELLLVKFLLDNKLYTDDCFKYMNISYMQLYEDTLSLNILTSLKEIECDDYYYYQISENDYLKLSQDKIIGPYQLNIIANNGINLKYTRNVVYGYILAHIFLEQFKKDHKTGMNLMNEFINNMYTKKNDELISGISVTDDDILEFTSLKKEIIDNQQKCLQLFK